MQIVVGESKDMVAEYGVQHDGSPFMVIMIDAGEIISVDEWPCIERAKKAYNWGQPSADGEACAYLEI